MASFFFSLFRSVFFSKSISISVICQSVGAPFKNTKAKENNWLR